MVREVKGREVQLDGDTLRAMASALTKLNGLAELTAEFNEDEEKIRVRVELPEFLELKNSAGDTVSTVTRRSDGSWALSAVVASGG